MSQGVRVVKRKKEFRIRDFGGSSPNALAKKWSGPAVGLNGAEAPPSPFAGDASAVQWVSEDPGSYESCGVTVERIPAGIYEIGWNDRSRKVHFSRKRIELDEMIRFSDWLIQDILAEIERFWEAAAKFAEKGMLHRRGMMFYGPPGGGKTVLSNMVVHDLITQKDGVAFIVGETTPDLCSIAFQDFRRVEPERRIVCVFEDLEEIVERRGERQILALLDGDDQVNHILQIATTNYPERLDPRIVGRPCRFDRVYRIDMPSASIRDEYLRVRMAELKESERRRWVTLTEGLSLAALRELVASVACLGNDVDETVEILRELEGRRFSSKEMKQLPGFRGTNPILERSGRNGRRAKVAG